MPFWTTGKGRLEIIKENLLPTEVGKLVRLAHYSHQIGKEKYRETVLNEIADGISRS